MSCDSSPEVIVRIKHAYKKNIKIKNGVVIVILLNSGISKAWIS
jgi:hypothetical protein